MRPATANDIGYLTQVYLDSMREHITASRGWWDVNQETLQFLRELDLNCTRIVQRDGVDLEFVMTPRLLGNVQIHTFCVSPEHQGHGVGAAIITSVIDGSIARGLAVVISVLKVNTRARAFYERLGFEIVNESEHHHHMRCVTGRCASQPAGRVARTKAIQA